MCIIPVEVNCKLVVGKFNAILLDHLAIYKCISPNQFLLMSLDGVLYPMVVEEARLKPGLIPTHKGPARTMSELKNAAKLVYTSTPHLQCISTGNSSSNQFASI